MNGKERVQPEGTRVTLLPPDIKGSAGGAWKMRIEDVLKRHPDDLAVQASVAGWIVDSKWADKRYPYTLIAVCTLSKPGNSGKPSEIRVEGATHEVIVMPLPDWQIPVVDNTFYLRGAGPSFVGQFKAESDEAAAERVTGDVCEIANAKLIPTDEGYAQWVHRYGDACVDEEPQFDIEGLHVTADGEVESLDLSGNEPLLDALKKAVADRMDKTGVKSGTFAITEDATVTPGCDCPMCSLIREVRKQQGREVLTHDGSIEAPAGVVH